MLTHTKRTAILIGCCIALGLNINLSAQVAAFREYGAPPSETLQLPVSARANDIPYVSLLDLINNLGGATTITPNRMRIDLNSTTAWVGLNDNRVNALSIFTLGHNIISDDSGVYIAVADCQSFFKKSFRLNLGVETKTNPTPNPSRTTQSEFDPTRELFEDTSSVTTAPARNRAIRTIVINAGHGGFESGVEGPTGALEKDITLLIAQQVNDILAGTKDATIHLIRDSDTDVTIQQRSVMVQSARADLLISLHLGGSFSPETAGLAAFYPEQGSQRGSKGLSLRWRASDIATASRGAAEILLSTLETELGLPTRGIHPITNPLFKSISGPAVLIELGCLTNPDEETRLRDPDYQHKLATALATSIRQLITESGKPAPVQKFDNESILEAQRNQ
ncbi:MAG: N-acetylmuramoyl-L-alanine amidase [Candidatus Hydrogenedentota bacterium]